MRRQHDVPQEIPDSQCDLRHIKKTTDIYAEFTDDHQLQSLPSSATKSNACADHGVMQERQIVWCGAFRLMARYKRVVFGQQHG